MRQHAGRSEPGIQNRGWGALRRPEWGRV